MKIITIKIVTIKIWSKVVLIVIVIVSFLRKIALPQKTYPRNVE